MCLASGEERHAATLQFAVDGGAGHVEEFGDLRLGVLAPVLDVEHELALRDR